MAGYTISIIGAGNVGTQLALAFHRAGHTLREICSNNRRHAAALARKVNAQWACDSGVLDGKSQIYILCIPDPAIRALQNKWPHKDIILCHTSGPTPMGLLSGLSDHFGVFYPLQTISKEKDISFRRVPVCLEASDEQTLQVITGLARSISGDIRLLDSEQRRLVHLTAVIANNFSNFVYAKAEELLGKNGLPFNLLHALIKETASKASRMSPHAAQTGPAARGDTTTLNEHLKMLKDDPLLYQIYQMISDEILRTYRKGDGI